MDKQFRHPASNPVLADVADFFKKKKIFSSNDRHIIFVCGGKRRSHMRARFLGYAKTEIRHMRMFRAESAANDLISQGEPAPLDVAAFEDLIADVSDCVLIFPESPGSIAELAYFCRKDTICEKILVVSEASLQTEDSFINLGPLAIVDKKSIFRKAIQADYKAPDFSLVRKRLKRLPKGRRQFVYQPFQQLSGQVKLFVLYEIIRIFSAINLDGVEKCVKAAFGDVDREELKRLLSILCATNYVSRVGLDSQFLRTVHDGNEFLRYSRSILNSLKMRIRDYYRAHEPTVFALINGADR